MSTEPNHLPASKPHIMYIHVYVDMCVFACGCLSVMILLKSLVLMEGFANDEDDDDDGALIIEQLNC